MNPKNHSSNNSQKEHFDFLALGGIILWCFLLLFNQFHTLAGLTEKIPPGARFGSFARFQEFTGSTGKLAFSGADRFAFWLLWIIPLFLVFLEYKKGSLTRISRSLQKRKKLFPILLFLFFIILSRFYLHPGDFTYTGDAAPMLGSISEAQLNIQNGNFPNYSTLAYNGWNSRQYLGHLFSWTGGLFSAVFGLQLGVKTLLLLFNALSGFFLYFWVLRLTKNKRAAIASAIVYALHPWHYQQIVTMGRLNLSAIYAQMPLIFLLFERLFQDQHLRQRNSVFLALSITWILLTHLVWGLGILGLFTIYAGIRIFFQRKNSSTKSILLFTLMAFLLAGIFAGGTLLSVKVRKEQSMAFLYEGKKEPHNVDYSKRIMPHTLVKWTNGWISPFNIPPRSWYNSYLGITPLILTLMAFLLLIKPWGKKEEYGKLFSAASLWIAGMFLVFTYFVLIRIPLIKAIRIFPDHRYQTYMILGLSAMTGFGILWWTRFLKTKKWNPGIIRALALLPLGLIALDIGSTSFQFPFGKTQPWAVQSPVWKAYRKEADKIAKEHQFLSWKLFIEGKSPYDYLLRTPGLSMARLHVPSDQGPHNHLAPRSSQYSQQFYETFHNELQQNKTGGLFPSKFAADWFYLNNFHDAIFFAYKRNFDPNVFAAAKAIGSQLILARFKNRSPAIASTTLQSWYWKNIYELNHADELEDLLIHMGINQPLATARSLYTNSLAYSKAIPSLQDTSSLQFIIHELKTHPKYFEYSLESNRDCWVRLNASWYDYLNVEIDGNPVQYMPSATWNVLLKMPMGKHTITVRGGWDPFIFWTSLPALFILIVSIFIAWKFPAGFKTEEVHEV